ncbi:MAG: hypothetical protein M3Y58_15815 [Chloroflexota bacterium]|nr:hypothetical protein [Chloroflexota bacterium]
MRNSQMRRWFAAGITGTLFVMLMLALAAPVAADGNGLVTQPAGQGGNSIVYVTSPGFANNGTAVNPITCADPSCGTNAVCTANACYPAGTVCDANGCGIPNNGVFCNVANGCGVPINYGNCAFYGCAGQVYGPGQIYGNCAAGGCGTLGYTAAGPIVGVDNNGNPIVYDVRGGSFDTYTRAANGQVCEADSHGNCQKGDPANP